MVSVSNSKGIIAGYTATLRPNLINNFHYGFIRQGVGTIGQLNHNYIEFGNGPDSLNANTFTTKSDVPVHNVTDDWRGSKEDILSVLAGTFASLPATATPTPIPSRLRGPMICG